MGKLVEPFLEVNLCVTPRGIKDLGLREAKDLILALAA